MPKFPNLEEDLEKTFLFKNKLSQKLDKLPVFEENKSFIGKSLVDDMSDLSILSRIDNGPDSIQRDNSPNIQNKPTAWKEDDNTKTTARSSFLLKKDQFSSIS